MIRRRVLYLLLVVILLLSFNVKADAQEGDSETFANGLRVSGEFLKFYRGVDDPGRLFGQPYTKAFIDPMRPGIQIQYFDRVRMEYDPAKPEGERVSLADLGSFAHDDAEVGQPFPTAANMCQTISGHAVCYAFRDLYNRYGEKYFGTPITEAQIADNGRVVQYFTRVRMEWRVEMPTGQKVVLTELGKIDFEKRIANPIYKQPDDPRIPGVIQPKLYAFVARPLVANGNKQYVFALLYDQYDQPIQGAKITIKVTNPDKNQSPVIPNMPSIPTNEFGFTTSEFPVVNLKENQEILVTVEAQIENGPSATASTWFRVWW